MSLGVVVAHLFPAGRRSRGRWVFLVPTLALFVMGSALPAQGAVVDDQATWPIVYELDGGRWDDGLHPLEAPTELSGAETATVTAVPIAAFSGLEFVGWTTEKINDPTYPLHVTQDTDTQIVLTAQYAPIDTGDFVVSAETDPNYTFMDGTLTLGHGTYDVTLGEGIDDTVQRIVVDTTNGPVDLTIEDVVIDRTALGVDLGAPLTVVGTDAAFIRLLGVNAVTAAPNGSAPGVEKIGTSNLTITSGLTSGKRPGGSLTAIGGTDAVGIGGVPDGTCANITIRGGDITAIGGGNTTGIGRCESLAIVGSDLDHPTKVTANGMAGVSVASLGGSIQSWSSPTQPAGDLWGNAWVATGSEYLKIVAPVRTYSITYQMCFDGWCSDMLPPNLRLNFTALDLIDIDVTPDIPAGAETFLGWIVNGHGAPQKVVRIGHGTTYDLVLSAEYSAKSAPPTASPGPTKTATTPPSISPTRPPAGSTAGTNTTTTTAHRIADTGTTAMSIAVTALALLVAGAVVLLTRRSA